MIVLFSVVVFGVIFWILGTTFLSVTTQNRGTKKKKYKAKQSKSVPVILWLVKKEIMRFFKNPMLFLNAGMGTVLSLILGVVAIFNGDLASTLREMTGVQEISSIVAVLACFFATSNVFTAASISLEGECLWILQSTPIKVKEIFLGKIGMHCFFTLIPAYFAAIIVCVMLKIPLPITLLVLLLIAVLTVASACVGLAVNLKFPNLHWTNEIAAVKQSVSSLIVMFGGWGASLLVLGGWFLLKKYLSLWVFLSVCILLFAVVGAGMIAWLFGRGKKVFENL
jgi:ABC-2 type transport system permease protein